MTIKTYEVFTCDRCGVKENTDEHPYAIERFYKWGKVWYAQSNGPIWLNKKGLPSDAKDCADVCPACIRDLNKWWENT